MWLCDRETSADAPPFLKVLFTHLRMRARTHMPRERASERGERERERERKRKRERARENVRTLFQVCPAHHIVSARQAYAHLPCFLRPGYPLPPRPSETLQRRPRRGRAPTSPAQAPRTSQRTPPATARPGPAHVAAPAVAHARPAPYSPTPNSMGRTCEHKAERAGPPVAEPPPERRKQEPRPPPSRRHPRAPTRARPPPPATPLPHGLHIGLFQQPIATKIGHGPQSGH